MRSRWLYVLYGLGTLLAATVLAFKVLSPIQVLPRIRLAPGFALIDQDGHPLSSEDLRGKVVLYTFYYTHCEGRCHDIIPTLQRIQAGLQALPQDIPVQIVLISFDPEHDTPERLRAFADQVGANPSIWRFATGEPQHLRYAIGGGFEVYYRRNPDGAFTFDPAFILVDPIGVIRGEYRYPTLTPDHERILRHIDVLLNEIRNAKGLAKGLYEAAHLFLCYPE